MLFWLVIGVMVNVRRVLLLLYGWSTDSYVHDVRQKQDVSDRIGTCDGGVCTSHHPVSSSFLRVSRRQNVISSCFRYQVARGVAAGFGSGLARGLA